MATRKSIKVAVICLLVILIAKQLAADEKAIARTYLAKAQELYTQGNNKRAAVLLEEAIDFFPEYSETLFLLGKIRCQTQETTFKGLALMERAFLNNTWSETSPQSCQQELANVYLRTRRFRQALSAVESLRRQSFFSPFVEIIRARSFYGLGDLQTGDVVMEEALKLFPWEKKIYLAYLESLVARRIWQRAWEITNRGIKEFSGEPEFLYYKSFFDSEKTEKKKLIDEYISKGGRNPAIALRALAGETGDYNRFTDFFFANGGDKQIDLIEFLVLAAGSKSDTLKYVVKKLGELSGEKILDADHDGFYEEKYVFQNNELERVVFDWDQNGQSEIIMFFAKGLFERMLYNNGQGAAIEYFYNNYPRLTRVKIEKEERVLYYDLVPDSFLFAPLQALPSVIEYRLRLYLVVGVTFPSEAHFIHVAYALTEESPDRAQPKKKWELYNGKRLILREDGDHDGRYEHTVIYDDNGYALSGLVDIDGDNLYEVRENYINGVLQGIEYDENKDGKPDYIERADGTRKEWDLNGDGIVDVVETRAGDGKIIWEYTGLFRQSR